MDDSRPVPVAMPEADEPQSFPLSRRSLLTYAASAPVVTATAGLVAPTRAEACPCR